jgi:hypothetical protein
VLLSKTLFVSWNLEYVDVLRNSKLQSSQRGLSANFVYTDGAQFMIAESELISVNVSSIRRDVWVHSMSAEVRLLCLYQVKKAGCVWFSDSSVGFVSAFLSLPPVFSTFN